MSRGPMKQDMGHQHLHQQAVARLTCPKCKKLGTLVFETMSDRWRTREARAVHELSAGFVAVDYSAAEDARIECAECRILARENGAP